MKQLNLSETMLYNQHFNGCCRTILDYTGLSSFPSGPKGRRFKSCHLDQQRTQILIQCLRPLFCLKNPYLLGFSGFFMFGGVSKCGLIWYIFVSEWSFASALWNENGWGVQKRVHSETEHFRVQSGMKKAEAHLASTLISFPFLNSNVMLPSRFTVPFSSSSDHTWLSHAWKLNTINEYSLFSESLNDNRFFLTY